MQAKVRLATCLAVLGTVAATACAGPASAEPTNYPTNPNACVGNSSTTANAQFQSTDPDKYRSDQARQADGQPGRADSVATIPQCQDAGLSRGTIG